MSISLSLLCKSLFISHNLQFPIQISNQEIASGYATTHNHLVGDTPSNQGVSSHQLQPINYLYIPFIESSWAFPCDALITNLQDASSYCLKPSLIELLLTSSLNKVPPMNRCPSRCFWSKALWTNITHLIMCIWFINVPSPTLMPEPMPCQGAHGIGLVFGSHWLQGLLMSCSCHAPPIPPVCLL